MTKSFLVSCLFCILMYTDGLSQSATPSTISTYTYHPPSTDKESWQRLNLLLSANFYRGMKLNKVGFDSGLIYISHLLGVSRLSVAAEGIEDPELIKESNWFDERNPGKGVQSLKQAKGKKHLEIMILLGAYYAYQPASYKHYRDSVEYFLKPVVSESKNGNEKGLGRVALCLLGKMYAGGLDTTNANAVFSQLINECREDGDKATEARAFNYRGEFKLYRTYNLQDKISDLQKAIEIYDEIKDTESEINVLTNLAFSYMIQDNFDNAYNAFVRVVDLEKSINYPYTQYSDDNAAMLGMAQDKFGEPLKYTLESIKAAQVTRDSMGSREFYLKLGQLYDMEGGRSEESLRWMLKALDGFVAANDGETYSTLFNVVGLMNEQSGRKKEALNLVLTISKKAPPFEADEQIFYNLSMATCYTSLKQYALAERHILTADSIQKLDPAIALLGTYQNSQISDLLNSLRFARGEYKTAKKYLEDLLVDSSRVTVLSDKIHAYQDLITIDSVFHDATSGVKHYKQYIALIDSSFRVSKIRQAEELQVLYQTEEQKNQIVTLNQQAKLEQTNLKQATIVKNLTIAGIIAVLIIAGLLYRQNRQKQKSNNIITQKNEQLQHFLTEKEWLLKEIHHRVKNNLQIVMSLLNSQSAYIDNDIALTAIHDSQHRVHAMSLIHQKLYGSENVSSIDMSSYIRELASYLQDSFNTGQRIHFEFNITPLELDVSQAVPLGLILNEAITNSIKYAFPDNKEGLINISLANTALDNYILLISDNGIGMSAHFTEQKPGSLGMSLMAGLSEDLDGKFTVENNNGTIVRISFVHDLTAKRQDIEPHHLLPIIKTE